MNSQRLYLVAHTMHLCGALLLFVFNVDDYRIPRNSNTSNAH